MDKNALIGLAVPAAAIGGMYLLKRQTSLSRGNISILGMNCGQVTVDPWVQTKVYVTVDYEYEFTSETSVTFTATAATGAGDATGSTTVTLNGTGTDSVTISIGGTWIPSIAPYGISLDAGGYDTATCTDAINTASLSTITITGATVS